MTCAPRGKTSCEERLRNSDGRRDAGRGDERGQGRGPGRNPSRPGILAKLLPVFLLRRQRRRRLAPGTHADGYKWQALGGGKSFLAPKVGKRKLMRDPCLLRAPDGAFQLVWTDSWDSRTIGHASSKDLLHWSPQQAIAVMAHEPQAMNCWAPEVVYDQQRQQYVIFWSTTIPGRFPKTDGAGDGPYNHRVYATTTKDFKTFTPTRLLFDGGFNVIDATMLPAGAKYYLIVKDETLKPVKKNLRIAVGASAEGPFGEVSPPFTPSWVEGPSAIRIGDDYIVYFDCYTKGCYGAVRSRNLKDWEDITSRLDFPKGARHGTVLEMPRSVVDGLSAKR